MKPPAATRLTDRLLNPLIGKSLVVYAQKIIQPNGAALTSCEESAPNAGA